jgi:hypothetical protein
VWVDLALARADLALIRVDLALAWVDLAPAEMISIFLEGKIHRYDL